MHVSLHGLQPTGTVWEEVAQAANRRKCRRRGDDIGLLGMLCHVLSNKCGREAINRIADVKPTHYHIKLAITQRGSRLQPKEHTIILAAQVGHGL
jgi:hypothetical protein